MAEMYNANWPEHWTQNEIELHCFKVGHTIEGGGLGKAGHFRRVVERLWPAHERNGFKWHPWAEDMLRCACEHQNLVVSGGSGCGKSAFFGLWALVNWMCDPLNTIVLITSISLAGSRKRIWSYVVDYFRSAPKGSMPGKVVDSIGMIRSQSEDGSIKASDRAGIALIASDAKHEKEAIGKFAGVHNERVFLIGDELPELSPAVVTAALGNLKQNPYFQFIGIGNPGSIYDPHGQLATPKAGWSSVSAVDEEWQTNSGWHIRFDAERSPNIIEGHDRWPFLPTAAKLEAAKEEHGENSLTYWRQWRGFWCPEGSIAGIYTESDLVAYDCHEKDVKFVASTPVAFIDLGYTNGGDASMSVFGRCGLTIAGHNEMVMDAALRMTEDTTDKTERMTQIAKKYIAECKKRGVRRKYAGYDGTASGMMFGELLSALWDDDDGRPYKVDFAGAPSDMAVSGGNVASDVFYDRVSELWVVGKSYMQARQLKGITVALARQMIARMSEAAKRGDRSVTKVESKKKMKKRIGQSPDLADAYFGMLDLCRRRLTFRALTVSARRSGKAWHALQLAAAAPEESAVPVNPGAELPGLEGGPRKKFRWKAQSDDAEGWGSMNVFG